MIHIGGGGGEGIWVGESDAYFSKYEKQNNDNINEKITNCCKKIQLL